MLALKTSANAAAPIARNVELPSQGVKKVLILRNAFGSVEGVNLFEIVHVLESRQ